MSDFDDDDCGEDMNCGSPYCPAHGPEVRGYDWLHDEGEDDDEEDALCESPCPECPAPPVPEAVTNIIASIAASVDGMLSFPDPHRG